MGHPNRKIIENVMRVKDNLSTSKVKSDGIVDARSGYSHCRIHYGDTLLIHSEARVNPGNESSIDFLIHYGEGHNKEYPPELESLFKELDGNIVLGQRIEYKHGKSLQAELKISLSIKEDPYKMALIWQELEARAHKIIDAARM